MMALPFLFFIVLLWLGREELGLQGILACLGTWTALLFGCALLGLSPHVFIAMQALLGIVLILTLFGGDIYIR